MRDHVNDRARLVCRTMMLCADIGAAVSDGEFYRTALARRRAASKIIRHSAALNEPVEGDVDAVVAEVFGERWTGRLSRRGGAA